MKNRVIIAGLLLAVSVVLPASSVRATVVLPYNPVTMTALANQANQAAAAANSLAISTQQQANQAALLAAAANQAAYTKQAEANLAAINAAAANQAACNLIILNNPVLLAQASKPVCTVDPRARNYQLLQNINTIDQARLAAVNARAAANSTLSRLNDINATLQATKVEVVTNPGLTQRLNELTAMSNALQAQYDQLNKDASAKEENFKKLQATLPTAGYNPEYWRCYY
jgi:hypothetical protein